METKNAKVRVLEFFFIHPTVKIHARELARKIHLSHTAVRKNIKSGVIISEKKGNLVFYYAQKDTTAFKQEKLIYNLRSLYNSKLIDCLIDTYNHPKAIVLFGSYRYGEDLENSDIDIAILTKNHHILELSHFEKMLNRHLSVKEIDRVNKEFLTTLANGIVLAGYLELK